MQQVYERYRARRKKIRTILSLNPSDIVLLVAAPEQHSRFEQDKTFLYYTGISEPSAMLLMTGEGHETLFVPSYQGVRAQWVAQEIVADSQEASRYGVDAISYLGHPQGGYSFIPFHKTTDYEQLIPFLESYRDRGGSIHVVGHPLWSAHSYAQQFSYYLQHTLRYDRLVDISATVAQMRRCKDEYEIAAIKQAIAITGQAQEAAFNALRPGVKECEVAAEIEAVYMRNGCLHPAFPSIVATGKNATVLHYLDVAAPMKKGDAVVIDIGVSYQGYAADITRTYCVGDAFNQRQAFLYDLVLECQSYIARIARPGMYLHNVEKPDLSLNHLTREFFAQHDLQQYMPHGIGHFMGLDVHDVGDRSIPLQPGDVITIEPGLYIGHEAIGIRIEDDYLITQDGAVCLSEQIKKEREAVEAKG